MFSPSLLWQQGPLNSATRLSVSARWGKASFGGEREIDHLATEGVTSITHELAKEKKSGFEHFDLPSSPCPLFML
jgi:hypothetical protein